MTETTKNEMNFEELDDIDDIDDLLDEIEEYEKQEEQRRASEILAEAQMKLNLLKSQKKAASNGGKENPPNTQNPPKNTTKPVAPKETQNCIASEAKQNIAIENSENKQNGGEDIQNTAVKVVENGLSAWIRSRWKSGSFCEIYSKSGSRWFKGNIQRVFDDAEGEWLEVQYINGGKSKRCKQTPRYDMRAIRPLSKAMSIYKYVYNAAIFKKKEKSAAINMAALTFNYPNEVQNCTILNNQHIVQINIGSKCTLSVRGKVYQLKQFHFHTPAQHAIDNKHYEMEMHLVHVNEKNEVVVLGFIFSTQSQQKSEGNDFLHQFWDELPLNKTADDMELNNGLSFDYLFEKLSNNFVKTVKTKEINIDMELLATPPYTQGAQWLVSKTTHFISNEQLEKLNGCCNHDNNARQTQKCFGRTV